MNFDLTDEQRRDPRAVREFAEGEVAPVAEELDREKRFPYEIVAKLGELGPDGHPVPRGVRRRRRRHLSYALAIEELARVDSSVAITLSRTPRSARSRSTRSARGAEAASGCPTSAPGEQLGAFGLTEPEAGSDAGNTRTRARSTTATG